MKIPIIINNRNLLTYPKKMVEDLKTFEGVGEIILLDNGSTYEPLIEWYNSNPCEIIKTSNNGHLSPWIIDLPKKLSSDFYVVTDPDLDLSETPKDSLVFLLEKLKSHTNYDKIGLSLKNWEVSIDSPYHQFLKDWSVINWDTNSIYDGLLVNQKIDTTFAMYHINKNYAGQSCATYKPYSVNHIPWEFTSKTIMNMKEENYEYYYYLKNSNSSSSYKWFIGFDNLK
jgi:hypothetical protein